MGEKTIFFFPSWLPSLFIFHLILEMAKYWLTDRETRDIDRHTFANVCCPRVSLKHSSLIWKEKSSHTHFEHGGVVFFLSGFAILHQACGSFEAG